jgi:hypothetical protein
VDWILKLGERFLDSLPEPGLAASHGFPNPLLSLGERETLGDVANQLDPQIFQLLEFLRRETGKISDVVLWKLLVADIIKFAG